MTMSGNDTQMHLPLPAPPRPEDQPYIPVRMVNEWVYCPRLAWLMWVESEWADTEDTERGRRVHVRSDAPSGELPPPDGIATAEAEQEIDDMRTRVRALTVSSDRLGLIAKLDLLDLEDGRVSVVDIKKGRRPHVSKGAYEPERVQLCLQAMILEDNGYDVAEAAIWYAGSRERVRITLDAELRATAMQAASDMRLALAAGRRPPPLEDSPKCVRCALAGICLPDETVWFRRPSTAPRPLNPGDDPAMPFHVQTPGARIGKKGETLVVTIGDERIETPLIDIADVSLFGPVSISTPALHALLRQGSTVAWFSTGGWFHGHAEGTGLRSPHVRKAQYRAFFDERRRLDLARGLIEAKIRNQRTLLRRNWRAGRGEGGEKEAVLLRLKRLYEKVPHAASMQMLLGLEGEAAAVYFSSFRHMLSAEDGDGPAFDFRKRNRRPPADPVNALLSLGYALLTRQMTAQLVTTGFDPWFGFYHVERPGRPSLALDMMEPWRPVIVDSVVIGTINNGEIKPADFVRNGPSCALKERARKRFLAAYERRMSLEATHPLFGYRVSMRRMIEVQLRLFARHLDGEIGRYLHYVPR